MLDETSKFEIDDSKRAGDPGTSCDVTPEVLSLV